MSNRARSLTAAQAVEGLQKVTTDPKLTQWLRGVLERTSFWQENRTAITNVAGLILNLLMFIPLVIGGMSPEVAAFVFLGVQGLTAIIGMIVPDAVSAKQARALVSEVKEEAASGKHHLQD